MTPYSDADKARFVGEDPAQKSADRDDFARDRARVLHSAGLRRLAAKTQVLQPDSDEFVRNRLTHSLEVAQIGREFGAALGCNADVVDTACLAHDLGHPPFGHSGEAALDRACASIGGFEGNAQTFRLVTRLEAKRVAADGRSVGLNLTRASLDATSKYPWFRGESPTGTAKFGCYEDDAEVFEWVRTGAAPARRCIEAQVMDWSDDVAYSVHDVEDGITSGHIDPRVLRSTVEVGDLASLAQRLYAPSLDLGQLADALVRLADSQVVPARFDGTRSSSAALKDMTSRLIGRFVGEVVRATREAHGLDDLTRFAADIVIPDAVLAECVMLKAVAARHVMYTDERRRLVGRQHEVIEHLVIAFVNAPDRLDALFRDDFQQATDDARRLRVVADQIASLTDQRAYRLDKEFV